MDENVRTDKTSGEWIQNISKKVKKFVMQTTHSFSVDFIVRKCRENKTRALIYARITVDEERREISLKEAIDAASWDGRKEAVKGKTVQSRSLNEHIEEVRFKSNQSIACYRKIQHL